MTNEEILNAILDDHDGRSEYYDFDDSDYLDVDEAEEWTQNHKSQYRQVVYWSTKHNVHVAVNESRSGSYHSDWYYDEPTVELVKKVEKVVTRTEVSWVTL